MVSFVVYNVNGLYNTQLFLDKPCCFLQHLFNSLADFTFILETHFTPTNNSWALISIVIFALYMQKQHRCALIPLWPRVCFFNPHTDEEG